MDNHKIAGYPRVLNIPVLFLVFASFSFSQVLAYDDLRGKNCKAKRLHLKGLAAKNVSVKWEGYIRLRLQCDVGYDYPLNFNPDTVNTITCGGDDLWSPDFLPDCNEEVVPKGLTFTIITTTEAGGMSGCAQRPFEFFRNFCEGSCEVQKSTTFKCQNAKVGDLKLVVVAPVRRGQGPTALNALKYELLTRILHRVGMPSHSGTKYHTVAHCPPGSIGVYTHEGMKCRGCPIGFFLDSTKIVCTPCPKGHFNHKPMQPRCEKCPALKNATDKDIWKQVERISMNRMYTWLDCPLLVRMDNGTVQVSAPRDLLRKHETPSGENTTPGSWNATKQAAGNSATEVESRLVALFIWLLVVVVVMNARI